MAIDLQNDKEAKVLAQAVKNGQIPQERVEEAMAALRIWEKPSAGYSRYGGFKSLKQMGEVGIGVVDFAVTGAAAGFSEILSGLRGAARLVLNQGLDNAADTVRETPSLGPVTSHGESVAEVLIPPLAKLEESADRFAERKAMGHPVAATLIKTALLGGLDIAVPGKSAVKADIAVRDVLKKQKQIKAFADKHGIRIELKHFGDDIVDAAKRLSPEERAEYAPALQAALQEANKIEKTRVNALYDEARNSRTFVETSSVAELAGSISQSLIEEGFDIVDMPKVQKRLQELANFSEVSPSTGSKYPVAARNILELEMIRRRSIKNKSADVAENTALSAIRRQIDEFLDNEFNAAAIDGGRINRGDGVVFGEAGGVSAWRRARAAYSEWRNRFNEDKVIAQLIHKETTPEQIRQWLTGASAMNARKEAALTLRRMKDVLGEDHAAIRGVRLDFIHELVAPLFDESSNHAQYRSKFRRFVKNYDDMVKKNPTLVREMGIDAGDLKDLRDFARVQIEKPPGGVIFSDLKDVIRSVSQLTVGHDIARQGLKVKLGARLGNWATGADVVSTRQIMADIMEVKFGEPAIPRRDVLAAQFIAGAALTGITEDEE